MKQSATGSAHPLPRRRFLKGGMLAAGIASAVPGLWRTGVFAADRERDRNGLGRDPQDDDREITKGDIAILRFVAAAELLETDLWQQYTELAGTTAPESGYRSAIEVLDEDMPDYIADNTDDEVSHAAFLNAYLLSKGAQPVNLDQFRTLESSKATGAQQIGRLTNLFKLTVDTSWWTRYRSDQNPDFGATFPQAIPSLAVGQHPGIPKTDAESGPPNVISNHIQAVANTAGFHFAFIEQGGTSLYPELAQRATNVEVLRVLLSIGPTESMHFQTWHDKAGNAPAVTDGALVFPDLGSGKFATDELFKKSLIMPEPCTFLRKSFPPCSIVRPTATAGAAMRAAAALTANGLFIGQSAAFFEALRDLATAADNARREDS
jgi:Ferritin-like domain